MKRASTVLVHKKGNHEDLKNYRPISLLSIFSKIFEQVMSSYISDHLERNCVLAENQFGFRRNRGTQDAVLHMQDFVSNALDAEFTPAVVLQ